MNNKTKGFIYGAIAAASYGMNPLFTLPLYAAGMSVDTVLFYRYAFAVIVLGVLMKLQGQSFTLRKADILPLVIMGLLFFVFISASIHELQLYGCRYCFYHSVRLSGDGSCDHGRLFQREDFRNHRFFDPVGTSGIALLYQGDGNKPLSTVGIIFVLLSSLSYAIYIVGVNRSSLKTLPTTKLTFYAILFGLSVYIVRLNFCTELQIIPSPLLWADVLPWPFSHCRVIDLHRISHSIYRLHSYCYTRCSGACDSVIFRGPPVSRKTDSPINGRYFNDYHCRYIDYHRQVAYKKDECAVADKQKIVYFC